MANVYENVLEYYLVNGKIRIGKKELVFELLRKDSILRGLFGVDAGDVNPTLTIADMSDEEDDVVINIGQREKVKFENDPTPALNELKQRYGGHIGGTLTFSLYYTTHKTMSFIHANLDEDNISLQLKAAVK